MQVRRTLNQLYGNSKREHSSLGPEKRKEKKMGPKKMGPITIRTIHPSSNLQRLVIEEEEEEGGGKFSCLPGGGDLLRGKGPILTVLFDLPRGRGMGEPLSSYGGPGFAIL